MPAKTKTIRQKQLVPGLAPDAVYAAFVSGAKHSKMTGATATSNHRIGGKMTAWDGYISGKYLELEPGVRILQTWSAADFPEGSEPSLLEWKFAAKKAGTEVTMIHSKVPAEKAAAYEQGWIDYYWTPMQAYFAGLKKK